MFVDRMTVERLSAGLARSGPWSPFPQIDDRAAWTAVRAEPHLASSVEAILSQAEQVLGAEIDPLTGTMYMEFMRSGDRLQYEQNYFRRRAALSHLVIAECLTGEGRFLDRIVDHIWSILGEIYWCIPAHNFAGQHEMVTHKRANPWKSDDPLPVPQDEYLDLFNCETAAVLAEACYLLRPLLLERMPSLYHLVHQEIERRTLARLESDALFGWYHGKNNWTPWCAHNLLLTATYLTDDPDRLITIASKLMVPMQRFFDNLEESGSCIEGPSYWVVSAGRLAGFVDLVEARFGLQLGFERNAKFRAFGAHIARLHIGGNRFVNFADGALTVDLDHGLLARYAEMIHEQTLAGLIAQDIDRVAARKLARPISDRGHNEYNRQMLIHLTRLMFWTGGLPAAAPITHERSIWLSDMEVLVARQSVRAAEGLMLSAIAGTNDPAINHHSHNDVGQFSVYLNGEPQIIDLGQGAYSRSTFGPERYDIWYISSEGHNVPRINGHLQHAGAGTAAREVRFRHEGGVSALSFDAAPSYFADPAGHRVWRRITFDRAAARVAVEDRIELPEGLTAYTFPLHLADGEVTLGAPGLLTFRSAAGRLDIRAENLALVDVETVELTDPRHCEVWGPRIKRILLEAVDPGVGRFALAISGHAEAPMATGRRDSSNACGGPAVNSGARGRGGRSENQRQSGYHNLTSYPRVNLGGSTRQVLSEAPEMMVVAFTFETGGEGALHSHPHVQSTYVRSGRFRFTLGEETLEVGPGDSFVIPSGATHGCTCLEAGQLIDCFTPRRDDFL